MERAISLLYTLWCGEVTSGCRYKHARTFEILATIRDLTVGLMRSAKRGFRSRVCMVDFLLPLARVPRRHTQKERVTNLWQKIQELYHEYQPESRLEASSRSGRAWRFDMLSDAGPLELANVTWWSSRVLRVVGRRAAAGLLEHPSPAGQGPRTDRLDGTAWKRPNCW